MLNKIAKTLKVDISVPFRDFRYYNNYRRYNMKPVKLVSVSAVVRDTGKVSVYAVDDMGQLWLGYTAPSNSDKYVWEKIEGPTAEDPIPTSRDW